MTRKIPDYLRLHTAEPSLPKPRQADVVDKFWRSFAEATGWAVERATVANSVGASRQANVAGRTVHLRDNVGSMTVGSIDEMLAAPSVSRDSAFELAEAAAELTEVLQQAQETIRQQNVRLAELESAAVAPVSTPLLGSATDESRGTELIAKARKAIQPLKSAAAWQQRQQPLQASPAEGWTFAGWTEAPLALASSWFYWDVLPDGMLACVIAEAHGQGYESAMIAATARSAWQAHCNYRHDPAKMLQRISDTLWQTNSGEQLLSCLYAQINPETGEGSIAAAGRLSGIISGRYGYRPLVEPTQPIGACIDLHPQSRHLQLQRGESLFAYTPATVDPSGGSHSAQPLTQQKLADLIRRGQCLPLEDQVKSIRQAVRKRGPAQADRTVLAFHRSSVVGS